ncbi:MAG: hypothetical protein ACI379_10140 [Nocardioides sp.]|uniref:hypothetical protein n=1 Tax=Nocardioides sp. TaxID=35761 RepID=UPI003F05AA17
MTQLQPTRRTVVRTAAWTVPAVTLVTAAPAFAASSNYTDLSTTAPVAPTRTGAQTLQMPTTMTFTNTGDLAVDGIEVLITSSIAVSEMTVDLGAPIPVEGLAGITIAPSLAAGPQTSFKLTVPPGGLLQIPAGQSAGLPVPLDLTLAAPGDVELRMIVTGINAEATENIPFSPDPFAIPAI